MKHLLIIGCGGFGREVFWTARRAIGYGTEWDIKGYLDGDVKLPEEEYKKLSAPVLGDIFHYQIEPDDVFACAIGDSKTREKIVTYMEEERHAEFISIICRTAFVQGNTKIGRGTILCNNTTVGDGAELGNFVILNITSSCGHDALVEDFVSIMGGVHVTGYGHVKRGAYMGGGSYLLPHGVVGEYATVGSGAIVLRRVKPNTTVYGNPARELK